jgi:chromosome segregation ATPase
MQHVRIATLLVLVGAVAAGGCARSVKRENASLKEQNAELSYTLGESEEAREEYESRYNESKTNLAKANERIKELTTQLQSAKKAAVAAQTKYNDAYKNLQAIQGKADQDARSLNEANAQMAVLKATLERTSAEAAAARDNANVQIAELSRQIASLQAKVGEQAKAPVASTPRIGSKPTAAANEK